MILYDDVYDDVKVQVCVHCSICMLICSAQPARHVPANPLIITQIVAITELHMLQKAATPGGRKLA